MPKSATSQWIVYACPNTDLLIPLQVDYISIRLQATLFTIRLNNLEDPVDTIKYLIPPPGLDLI
jgi:hypothetical protein